MGLSIHYSGTIKDPEQIPQLAEEVQDVCIAFDWSYCLVNDEALTGISFSPPECETILIVSFFNYIL